MNIDPANPVVALCAAGMAVEGDAAAARLLFEQAWQARTDDYDASIAAHFLARHQPDAAARVRWNTIAAQHAEAVADGRTREFKSSVYLNLADSYLAAGDRVAAEDAIAMSSACLADLSDGGYRAFVERGIAGVYARLADSGGD